MKDKSLKIKKRFNEAVAHRHERLDWIRNLHGMDDCRFKFIVWAEKHTHLDLCGMYGGDLEPVFRPAVCAWEGWKAAWADREVSSE